MKRRHFLEFAGSALTILGLNQLDLQKQAVNYGRVLAQSTPRKLALLVGINEYSEASSFTKLYGCVTDVNLQKALLTHRFGFNNADIVTLTDAQATRQGILEAFEEHLIKQAKPGDVVVFHYSGHGSRIADHDRDHADGTNSTFVPVDSTLPPGFPNQGGTVMDITGHTLFLLTKAINTDNFTAILDSCHSGGGTRGNLRIRSVDGGPQLQISPQEQEYQEKWLSRLNLSADEYIKQRRIGIGNGAIVASAKREQLAADAPFSDFDAGVFTYVLTQYLWQQTSGETISNTIPNIARSTTRLSSQRQEPDYEVEPNTNNDKQALYFINPALPPADAVIEQVTGQQVQIWLGGIDPQNMTAFEKGASFTAVGSDNTEIGEIQLESRQGLIGTGKIVQGASAIKPGTSLQERVRSLPSDFSLIIGLDPTLGQESAAAKQALDKLSRVKAIPLQQGQVNYILGRMTQSLYQEEVKKQTKNIPTVGTLGLFSSGGDVIPGSFGPTGEAIASAITRLQPKLKSLLAAQMVKLTLNTDSSRLNVVVSLRPEGQNAQLVAQVFPTRGINKASGQPTKSSAPLTDASRLPLGTPVQFQVANQETSDLFVSLLVIDPTGEITVVFPNNWTASEAATRVAAGQTLSIPDSSQDSFQLIAQEPKGTVEVLCIASRVPLRQAMKQLQAIASRDGQSRGPVALTDPVEVMEGLLSDLDEGSRSRGSGSRGIGAIARATVDTSQLATMSITFEVI